MAFHLENKVIFISGGAGDIGRSRGVKGKSVTQPKGVMRSEL